MLFRDWGHFHGVWGAIEAVSNNNYEGCVSNNLAKYSLAFGKF